MKRIDDIRIIVLDNNILFLLKLRTCKIIKASPIPEAGR